MATDVTSLAYYASRAHLGGIAKEELATDEDYHELLSAKIDVPTAVNLWNMMFGAADALISLADIDLPQADFLDIVEQVYSGVKFDEVHLAPRPAPLPRILHEPYFPKYLAKIPDDARTPAAVVATTERLNEVLAGRGLSPSPHANGLVVGRVQSGKTRNYIGLMLKAADEGWNVIIVLTSAIKSLALQTRTRIAEEFASVGADNHQLVHELDFLSAHTANGLAGAELNGDYLYWGVAMKQVDSLNRIKDWLDITNQPIGSMRVLIIDDEADNATPDSNVGGNNILDDEEIDELIETIRRANGYENLADWFISLRERDWPDLGAITPEAQAFGEIYDLLNSNGSKRMIRDNIINIAAYRHILGMDDFTNPPVENQISNYFDASRGDGDNSCGTFVLLLKSILDIVRGRSAINAAVCKFVGPNPETGSYAYPFAKCAYIAYTATPYANILNESPSHTPIYADFIQSLEVTPQYFGVEAIFGHDIASVEPRMPIICPITEEEENNILIPLRQNGAINADSDLNCTCMNNTTEWRSLKIAVAWAFCTAAARRYMRSMIADENKRRKREHRWTTMIVNIHHVRDVHSATKCMLQYKDENQQSHGFIPMHLGTDEARAAFKEFCHDVWNEQTQKFPLQKFNELFNSNAEPSQNYGNGVADYPAWEDVAQNLDHFLVGWQQYVHSIVINSTPTGKEEQALYNQESGTMELTDDHLWIVSGGNTIGRGLTLPGLTVSYFDRLRDSTCVDTLTQMGRWFGYRPGYELLPRVWMNLASVGEMKRIAMLELRMHESIADNFRQNFSPSDPAHYQQIYCWGRGLSGRAMARRDVDTDIGTVGSADDYYISAERRLHVLDASADFIAQLGPQSGRTQGVMGGQYPYAATPLWENVDRNVVSAFLSSVLHFYPDRSRKILRGILRDIAGSEPTNWDVVIGNPRHVAESFNFGGHEVKVGSPNGVSLGADVVRTATARLHVSFYAMIRAEIINREDIATLKRYQELIVKSLTNKCSAEGVLPGHYNAALPAGNPGDSIARRLSLLIERLEAENGNEPVPEAIHARLDDVTDPMTNTSLRGFRNRSSGEYMARVHRSANHTRPTLQLYLVRPLGVDCSGAPCVNISFYWPGHAPDGFFTVCVDENPDFVRPVTPRVFCLNVEDILKQHDFPMQRRELLCRMLERLGLRCSESFFAAHITNPLDGFHYHKMTGRNAYCIDGWAEDDEQRLGNELLQVAITILQRENRAMTASRLLEMVVEEQPRFRDFFVPDRDTTALNALMTDEVLNANDITLTSQHPVTYKYHN